MSPALLLRLFAPWLAVLVFWCGLGSAWAAMLAYHAQILFWQWRAPGGRAWSPPSARLLPVVLASALAGPLVYLLLPVMTRVAPETWLAARGLSGPALTAMIAYFGLAHPVLEQMHWEPLRRRTPWAHPVFAGYHLLVLGSLLSAPWLVASFLVLAAASLLWDGLARRGRGLTAAVLSHALADAGIGLAVWLRL